MLVLYKNKNCPTLPLHFVISRCMFYLYRRIQVCNVLQRSNRLAPLLKVTRYDEIYRQSPSSKHLEKWIALLQGSGKRAGRNFPIGMGGRVSHHMRAC